MKRLLACVLLAFGILIVSLAADTPSSEAWTGTVYEFASVRWAGDRTSIIWPDGTVQKVIAFGGKKRPEAADERMWYLTGAINIMGKRGFEIAHATNDEVIMKRVAVK